MLLEDLFGRGEGDRELSDDDEDDDNDDEDELEEETGDLRRFPESLLTSLSRILIRNPASSCETELEVDLALRGA